MAPPSRSARGFGADASGTVWEVGLVTMPAFVAQADGSTIRPLIALVMEAAGGAGAGDRQCPPRPRGPLPSRSAPAGDQALRRAGGPGPTAEHQRAHPQRAIGRQGAGIGRGHGGSRRQRLAAMVGQRCCIRLGDASVTAGQMTLELQLNTLI